MLLKIDTSDTLPFEVVEDGAMIRKPKELMDYLGFLGTPLLRINEEDLPAPEAGRAIRERA